MERRAFALGIAVAVKKSRRALVWGLSAAATLTALFVSTKPETVRKTRVPRHAPSAHAAERGEPAPDPAVGLAALPVAEGPERVAAIPALGAPEAEPVTSAEASVEVRVVDRAGGPVAGARVRRPWVAHSVTDADGRAFLTLGDDVAALDAGTGTAEIAVSADGFITSDVELASLRPLVVTLERLPTVRGLLLDAFGAPVPGRATVSLEVLIGDREALAAIPSDLASSEAALAGRRLERMWSSGEATKTTYFDASLVAQEVRAETDGRGGFHVDDVPLGRLRSVTASVDGFVTTTIGSGIVLEPETSVHVDVVLDPGARVEGTVVDDESSVPLAGATVWAGKWFWDDAEPPLLQTTTDESGRFSLHGVQANRWPFSNSTSVHLALSARAEGHASPFGIGFVVVPWSKDGRYEVVLRLPHTPCSLSGTIRTPNGEPAPSVRVSLVAVIEEQRWRQTGTGADGRFSFEALESGRYLVVARLGEGAGGQAGETELTLTDGPATLDLELQASSESRIEGRVVDRDGAPLAHVAVECRTIIPIGGVRVRVSSETRRTDTGGRFVFAELPPGRYDLGVNDEDKRSFEPAVRELELPRDGILRGNDFVAGR